MNSPDVIACRLCNNAARIVASCGCFYCADCFQCCKSFNSIEKAICINCNRSINYSDYVDVTNQKKVMEVANGKFNNAVFRDNMLMLIKVNIFYMNI